MAKKDKDKKKIQEESLRSNMDDSIVSDVLGSYTGVPAGDDPYEKPIQDADDL